MKNFIMKWGNFFNKEKASENERSFQKKLKIDRFKLKGNYSKFENKMKSTIQQLDVRPREN